MGRGKSRINRFNLTFARSANSKNRDKSPKVPHFSQGGPAGPPPRSFLCHRLLPSCRLTGSFWVGADPRVRPRVGAHLGAPPQKIRPLDSDLRPLRKVLLVILSEAKDLVFILNYEILRSLRSLRMTVARDFRRSVIFFKGQAPSGFPQANSLTDLNISYPWI